MSEELYWLEANNFVYFLCNVWKLLFCNLYADSFIITWVWYKGRNVFLVVIWSVMNVSIVKVKLWKRICEILWSGIEIWRSWCGLAQSEKEYWIVEVNNLLVSFYWVIKRLVGQWVQWSYPEAIWAVGPSVFHNS